jgi:hypothetical protein
MMILNESRRAVNYFKLFDAPISKEAPLINEKGGKLVAPHPSVYFMAIKLLLLYNHVEYFIA